MQKKITEILLDVLHCKMSVDDASEKIMRLVDNKIEDDRSWASFKPGDMKG